MAEMVTSYFPEEILINIFSRLPTKSVGKCRCLAKQWRTLLSTPEFIKSHLARRPHQENIIFAERHYFILSIKEDSVCKRLEFPFHCSQVVGSCDGLVFLAKFFLKMFLMNPITLWHMEIPEPPLVLEKGVDLGMHGFGYDRFSDDYKVVTMYFYEDEIRYTRRLYVDVYSVKWGVWKRIGISPYHPLSSTLASEASRGVFVNDAIHWLAYPANKWDNIVNEPIHWLAYHGNIVVIAVFNLEDEVFHEIPLPSGIDVEGIEDLILLDGCLCVIGSETNYKTYVWIKKEYGLEESWIKFSVDCDYLQKPLCFTEDEEVMCLTTCAKSFVVYNLKDGTMRDMVVDVTPVVSTKACTTFVESLVSPALSDT